MTRTESAHSRTPDPIDRTARLSFAPRPSQPLASAPQPVMTDRRSGRRSASRRQEACLHLSPRHSQPCEPPRSPHFFFFCAENLKLDRLDQTCSHPCALQTEQHSRDVLRNSLHRSHRTRKQARPESVQLQDYSRQPNPTDHDRRKHILRYPQSLSHEPVSVG